MFAKRFKIGMRFVHKKDGKVRSKNRKIENVDVNKDINKENKIVALYEEQEAPPIPHNGGDGTSASSVGTSSPDIFHGGEYNNNKEYHRYQRHNNKNDVVITQNDLNSTHNGSSLIVRRGSEPTLTKVVSDDSGSFHPDFYPQKPCIKRWSAIASIDEAKSPRAFEADDENESDTPPPTLERAGLVGQEEEQNSPNSSFSTFSRGSSRQSLANNAAMFKWLDAQDRAQDQYEHAARKEPLGGRSDEDTKHTSPPITPPGKQGQLVVLPNSSGPLGIHVVPEFDNAGRERGLLIQSVETEGRIHSDGRIKPRDVIIEINGITLGGINFSKAQEVFRQALLAKDLRMLVIKAPPPLPDQPPPKDRPLSPIVPTAPSLVTPEKRSSRERSISSDRKVASVTPTKLEIKLPERSGDDSSSGKTPPSSPTRGPPPPVPARNPTTSLTNTRFVATNTRKIGRKIHIQLTKGPQGLGFSVTTRDNPTGGHAPIYIKNILPKGAAIEDGNLKPGDRLLEVNGIEMTGKSQTEAVTVLRNTKMGGVVNLVVSRQVEETDEKSDSESGAVQKRSNSSSSGVRVRPASTLGFMTSEPDSRTRLSISKSNQDLLDGDTKWLKEWDKAGDVVQDEKSPVEDVDPSTAFQREGFGRQSMSEKRKGHINPNMSEFYQKIKSGKDSGSSQFISADSEEVGPLLGLKKSSSMESLQRAVQEEEASEKNGKSHGKPGGRGVNESFRAAVDRSYEQTGEAMETVEEEGSEVGSVSQDGRSRAESLSQDGRSRASSVSGTDADKRSKKPKKDKEKEKGIFKGFFKLGKNKKPDSKAKSTEELRDSDKRADNVHKPIDNREWLHEQRQRAAEKQRVAEQKQREEQLGIEQQAFHQVPSPPHTGAGPGMSRADKIQQLRMEHQRRHRERQGQYPQDAEEERKIQELERQKQAARMNSESGYYGNVAIPPRQRLDESMKYERARPAFVDGEHYSHYQNIQEIQAQLRKHDYYQHRHHHQATPAGYTPSPYTREVNMPPPVAPPPSDPRYHHQRGYSVTPHSRDPHRGGTGSSSDLMHYGYYTPHHHHPAYRTTTPSPHPHAHTPANHSSANHSSAYMSHSALSKSTPQIIVNPPPQEYSRSRAYSEYDPEPRTIYRDPPYGSLPRRRDHREMPGSAQV